MIKLLFFCFWVTNSRLKKKIHLSYLLDGCIFIFSHYKHEADKWKKFLKYYSLNVGEPLEIDTTPQISKNLL